MNSRLARGAVASSCCILSCVVTFIGEAAALPRFGPFEVSGNVSTQELIRMTDVTQYSLVQQRNTLKLRLDFWALDGGKLLDRYAVPLVDRAKLFLLYRGVYDSIYDFTPGILQKNIYKQSIPDHLDDLSSSYRDSIKFENTLREAYTDLTLKNLPLSFRLGRQQIVWGETDNFRLLDRVNSLDLTWHLQQESWDELRIPYWMIKGLWDIGRFGPLSNTFVEAYWNPGDWYPAKKTFLPRPWSVPLTDPLPVAASKLNDAAKLFRTTLNLNGTLFRNTNLFHQGDYTRNPAQNSQAGIRFSAVTPQGLQFTLNYFYQRWAGDDGTNAASFAAVLNPTQELQALNANQLPIVAIAPYVHTAGFSLNYAEEDYTQTVYRMETIFEFGVPFTDSKKTYQEAPPGASLEERQKLAATKLVLGNDVFGVSKRDMWKGMLGFDRPTWIRPLNRKATFLILGQFFWHYLLDNPSIECAQPSTATNPCGGASNPQVKGFRGQFSTSGLATGSQPFIDKVRTWEVLTTLAATTFYSGGKIVPFLVYVLDPVNSYNMEVIWMVDYFVTNNVIVNLSQRYFINTVRHPVFETWGVAGTNRGRSETGIRLTYQF
jgi:hypothetical protein